MKRLHGPEMTLLCFALLFIAGVGWLLSKRPAPPPDDNKLHLVFRVEKPTTLQAFRGVDAALVVELRGPNTEYGLGKNPLRIWNSDPFLELRSARGVQTSRANSPAGWWRQVWKGGLNNARFINSRAIPPGTLRFGTNAVVSPASSAPLQGAPRVSGLWTVDRTQIKPFTFSALPRPPLVRLSSVKIIQINPGNIRGEAVFDLTGGAMSAQTPFDYEFSEGQSGMGSGSGSSDLTPQTATRRVREWTIYKPPVKASYTPKMVPLRITGRVSADNRWPLAFQIEPFDFAKVKTGQNLKFKS